MRSDDLSDAEIEAMFARLRWPPDGAPRCPRCGQGEPYTLAEYRRMRCRTKTCRGDFTLTSNTLFDCSKQSLRSILRIVEADCDGMSARAVARVSGVSYKTAFVLTGKLLEITDGLRMQMGVEKVLALALASPPSPKWTGYWTRSKRRGHVFT